MIWIVGSVGGLAWMWLLWQVHRRDGFFDRRPRVCLGCQRHFVRAGCPVHDPEERRAA